MAYWNPLVKESVSSMAATLITVAEIASLMINREKDRCRLKAMRLAIKAATFNRHELKPPTSGLLLIACQRGTKLLK